MITAYLIKAKHFALWQLQHNQALTTVLWKSKALLLEYNYQLSTAFKVFLFYISLVILGMFFNFFFLPNFIFIGEYIKKKTFYSFCLGVTSLPLLGMLGFALVGSLLGTLFLPALFFISLFYFFFSLYASTLVLGESISKKFTDRDHPYFEQFLGISLLYVLALIPYLGFIIFGSILLLGLGAVARLKFGVR